MQSLQLGPVSDIGNYSELKVMCSAAGWYVGTTYKDPEFNFEEPGTRESGYFSSSEEATAFLNYLENGGREGVRMNP